MAIDTVLPVTTSLIAHGDSISFIVDDTYTSMVIQVVTESSTESCYDSASGGAQAGYTVSVANSGGRDTFTLARDAGFDISPQLIHITEDESGSSTLTSLSYTLVSEHNYPQGDFPYNPIRVGDLTVTEEDAVVRTDVGWIDFNGTHFNVTDLGNGKVDVDTDITVYPTEIIQDGVSLSDHAESLSFSESVRVVEDTADNFSVFNQATNHSTTSQGSGTCDLLWQLDLDLTDDTGNHTFTAEGSATYGPGAVPGTASGSGFTSGASFFVTASGTAFQKSPGDTFSVYGMFRHGNQNTNSSPYFFLGGDINTSIDYAMVLVSGKLHYQDSGSGGLMDTGYLFPDDEWVHLGFTRSASDIVKVYANGRLLLTSGAHTAPALDGSYFSVGSAGVAANGYMHYGNYQSIKIVDATLTDAEMLQECRRMFGR